MKKITKAFEINDVCQLVGCCTENNWKVLAVLAEKLRVQNHFQCDLLDGAIKQKNVDLIEKMFAIGILQRSGGTVYYNTGNSLTQLDKYEWGRRNIKDAIKFLLDSGRGDIARRFATKAAYPSFDSLTDAAKEYMFANVLPGIDLFLDVNVSFDFSAEENSQLAEMVLDGLRKLNAFYQSKIDEGVELSCAHGPFYSFKGDVCGYDREDLYISFESKGKVKHCYYPDCYNRVKISSVFTFMNQAQLVEFRQLQVDIENMVGYLID